MGQKSVRHSTERLGSCHAVSKATLGLGRDHLLIGTVSPVRRDVVIAGPGYRLHRARERNDSQEAGLAQIGLHHINFIAN